MQTGEPWFSPELRQVLGGLIYPLYFADFETVNPAFPRFPGMRPYDQLPFQWQFTCRDEPGAELEHYEFLAMDANDPRREFITSLCCALGESGSIVVYSLVRVAKAFGNRCSLLPEFAERIKNIQGRLWDLLPVMRKHVYHPAFGGSFSLKRSACTHPRNDLRGHGRC